ncbi:hypothetical protein LPJ61_001096 [Coemansia biformis]|uniref:Uncharacterized protein n=1 Tax=Coemansia biformis TaxID=1286918 RepID=A0A9W7YHL3_9FUNG|nr:hypothetical protein LPJ61_001096 [Coemansia biformis]
MDASPDNSSLRGASQSSTGCCCNTHGRAAAGNAHAAPDAGSALLALSSEATALPDAHATERERLLWVALAQSRTEIRELQSQIRSLFSINLRYAEQLRHALAAEPARKRPRTSAPGARPLLPEAAGAATAMRPDPSSQPLLGVVGPLAPALPHLQAASHQQCAPQIHAVPMSLGTSPSSARHIYRGAAHLPSMHAIPPVERTSIAVADAAMGAGASSLLAQIPDTLPSGFSGARDPTLAWSSPRSADLPAVPSTDSSPTTRQLPVGSPPGQDAGVDTTVIGDPDAIPSIGKFSSPRALYQFRVRVSEYEQTHGSQWREKMDSKHRQNWSRISAVYNRILQLRGADAGDVAVERALQAVEDEMASSRATLTRYSQIVRKQLNNERRQSVHRASTSTRLAAQQQQHPAASTSIPGPHPQGLFGPN